jgi:hypothetical protein
VQPQGQAFPGGVDPRPQVQLQALELDIALVALPDRFDDTLPEHRPEPVGDHEGSHGSNPENCGE